MVSWSRSVSIAGKRESDACALEPWNREASDGIAREIPIILLARFWGRLSPRPDCVRRPNTTAGPLLPQAINNTTIDIGII